MFSAAHLTRFHDYFTSHHSHFINPPIFDIKQNGRLHCVPTDQCDDGGDVNFGDLSPVNGATNLDFAGFSGTRTGQKRFS